MRISPLVDPVDAQVAAIEAGRAFVELTSWRVVEVRGRDARSWLHDLVTADIRSLAEGTARRTLVLTPTGRIRADLHATATGEGFLLLQAPDQPEAVDRILAPYVLSSDVTLDDVSRRTSVFAVLGSVALDGAALWFTPSVLGVGSGALTPAGEAAERLRSALLAEDLLEASPRAVERWRVRIGEPRMGADFGPDSLPAEAGLESAIDFTKGCFLGQESVAKVRNLGHPPWAIVAVRSRAPVRVGMPVLAGGSAVGAVTSVADGEDVEALVRVRWTAAGEPLATDSGPLSLR